MKNHNDEAMTSYFNSMLNDKPITEVMVETATDTLTANAAVLPENLVFSETDIVNEPVLQTIEPVAPKKELEWKNIEVENEFQVLFFELSGLTFAVPLTDLGGIHHLDDSMNSLIGKPSWFSGVMTHGNSLFNIVDTAKWVNTGESADTLAYSHYILLGATPWGLSCEKLLGTETLNRSQIKWREVQGKRPWLAGMVKEKMCALIHAEELVKLLNSGMNIHGH
ncbi:chemotaxis protein CheW [Psychromonas hadalis]|uniref:chemotaxis protein CheW n=1 Tax=Psychromonas hadalis TaxID=211669 RepID=UPI0003B4A452|nr:chemotaxis protein CheW [Psychromonas hadalis]